MSKKLKTILVIFASLALPAAALADEVDCQGSCPDGERLVSFSDGDHASCTCSNEALMEETIPETYDPSLDIPANQSELDAQQNG